MVSNLKISVLKKIRLILFIMANDQISQKSSMFLLTNIWSLVFFRLDPSNCVLWEYHIFPILEAHKLFKYIDGMITPINLTIHIAYQTQVTLEYESWYEKDQTLITLVNATRRWSSNIKRGMRDFGETFFFINLC